MLTAIITKKLSDAKNFSGDGQTVNDISESIPSWLLWKQQRGGKNTSATSSSVSDIHCFILRILIASLRPTQHSNRST